MQCYKCKKELEDFGGLLFSPPIHKIDPMNVTKIHLCSKCYGRVIKFILEDVEYTKI